MLNRRGFERIQVKLQIGYEFVKWNEFRLDKMENPKFSTTFDISASGIGMYNLVDLSKSTLNKLIKGKMKVRLAIYLDSINPPLITFARLIWTNLHKKNNDNAALERFGFVFIDVSPVFFEEINKFINLYSSKK